MPSWINTSPAPHDTATAPAAVSVGAAAVQLLAANANRRSFLVSNLHATQVLHLGFHATDPATGTGIRVGPGETREIAGWTGIVKGIATGATTPVAVVEFSKTDSQ